MASQLKTIQELTAENATLKTRIRELEAAAAESNWTQDTLRRSQQLFSTIFHMNPAAVILSFFSDGKCVDVNEAYVRLTGYEREELIGKTTVELNIWTSTEERQRVVAELAEKGHLENVELTLRRKNGELINTIAGGEVITMGGQCYILSFFLNITERKRVEESLLVSEEKYRVLVEAAMESIFIAQDCRIRYCNKAFSEISGYGPADLAHMAFTDIVHPDDRQIVMERYIQRLEGKDIPSRYRFRFIDAWGNTRWADMSVALISWEGKPASLCHAAEITELKQVEEAKRLNEERLEALVTLNSMTDADERELTHYAMEVAVRLTGSAIGYIAFLNEDETVLTMYAWSAQAMRECAIADKPIAYPVASTGLWGEAVRQRKAIITNDYAVPNPLKKGVPEGHVHLTRHMNAPTFDDGRIVIVAGVEQKDRLRR